jgi:hypothetical protein
MRSLACVIALSVASGTAALAADYPPPIAPPAPYIPVAPPYLYNWSGFYIGGNLGAGFTNTGGPTDTFGSTFDTTTNTSFLGGGQIGVNYELWSFRDFRPWVLDVLGKGLFVPDDAGMCALLRYTGEHGCMAKIGEPWLGPARLLEHQGLIVLWRCLGGHYAAAYASRGGGAKRMASVRGRCCGLGSPRFNGVRGAISGLS